MIWQDQETRTLVHVGWLEFTGDEFVFSYTEDARSYTGFSPFPSFPVFEETYRSTELFPFFSIRLVNSADPRFEVTIDALGLTRSQATPAEVLARSPSDSPHDTIQVIPEPQEMPDGTLVRVFPASGVRHADQRDPERVGRLIGTLERGTRLEVVPEPQNPWNPRALQLAVHGTIVGWVPDYLVDEMHTYLSGSRPVSFTVERANGPETPWRLRLLCRMTLDAMDERHGREHEPPFGPGRLLNQVTKAVLERALDEELSDHLGYEKGDPAGRGSGNSRNGITPKRLHTEIGTIDLDVPRDRNGDFEPRIVPKGTSRLSGFNERIIALYARGVTVRDIRTHLAEIYGVDVSPDLISKITDAVWEELEEWRNRPLDAVYPIVYIDALVNQDPRRHGAEPACVFGCGRRPGGP